MSIHIVVDMSLYLVVEVLVTENQVTSSVVIVQSVTHQRPRVMTSDVTPYTIV